MLSALSPRALLAGIWLLLVALSANATPYDDALALYREKRYPEARVAFTQLATAEPQNAKPRYFLGVIALRRNDTEDAIQQLEQAVRLDPTNSDYHAELGGAYGAAARGASLLAQAGFARKCRAALEKAVELNPDNLDARNGLITYYRQAPGFLGGGMPKAYAQAGEIRSRDFHRGSLILAQLHADERRFDEAFAIAEELLQAEPDTYIAHYIIGRFAAESGRQLDHGEARLRHCLTLTPARNDPSHAAVHWRLGHIAEKRRDPAAARAAYEESLRLDPGFTQAADSLAKLK